ncbi:MAG: hypothetical protein E7270_02570 [Lachnospiraceae bacterium]|nr:hypothetical protein [Lachnospiraceae bacterium]
MNEQLKNILDKIKEFWNKYNKKQKTLMISIVAVLTVAFVIMYFVFNKTTYVTLVECESAQMASSVRECLDGAGIPYKISDTWVVTVDKADKVEAEMAISVEGVMATGYSLDDALSGGFDQTEADKEKKYKAYLEDKIRLSLESLDYVRSASVYLNIPTSKLSVLNSNEESSASITLKLKKDISSDVSENMAQWVATALGNDTTGSITIIDTEGNMLFRGTNSGDGDGYVGNSKNEMREVAMDTVVTNIRQLFEAANMYQTVEVSPYLDMNFDTVEVESIIYDTGDREQGPYTSSYESNSEGVTGVGGVPGTDSNDEDITYEIDTGGNSTSTYTLKKYEYAVNQVIERRTGERGKIDYTTSSVAISASSYVVYDEEVVEEAGLLEDMTWEEFKTQNANNIEITPEGEELDKIKELISNATGFAEDNITIMAYQIPQFVDKIQPTGSVMDYIPYFFAIVILALLAFVVYKSTRPVEVVEMEPELSVEALLSSTAEQQRAVDDIDLNEKSETRMAIEKFVDENPEAVAALLRNWLEEGWE